MCLDIFFFLHSFNKKTHPHLFVCGGILFFRHTQLSPIPFLQSTKMDIMTVGIGKGGEGRRGKEGALEVRENSNQIIFLVEI